MPRCLSFMYPLLALKTHYAIAANLPVIVNALPIIYNNNLGVQEIYNLEYTLLIII